MSFATWDMTDQEAGFMYCCPVEELRQAISYLPDLRDANDNWPNVIKVKGGISSST